MVARLWRSGGRVLAWWNGKMEGGWRSGTLVGQEAGIPLKEARRMVAWVAHNVVFAKVMCSLRHLYAWSRDTSRSPCISFRTQMEEC